MFRFFFLLLRQQGQIYKNLKSEFLKKSLQFGSTIAAVIMLRYTARGMHNYLYYYCSSYIGFVPVTGRCSVGCTKFVLSSILSFVLLFSQQLASKISKCAQNLWSYFLLCFLYLLVGVSREQQANWLCRRCWFAELLLLGAKFRLMVVEEVVSYYLFRSKQLVRFTLHQFLHISS